MLIEFSTRWATANVAANTRTLIDANDATNGVSIFLVNDGAGATTIRVVANVTTLNFTGQTLTRNTVYRIYVEWVGTAITVYFWPVSGSPTLVSTQAAGAAIASFATNINIGRNQSNANSLSGTIRKLLAFDAALTTGQMVAA